MSLPFRWGDDTFGFGQVCRDFDHAYFDLRSLTIPDLPDIVRYPVIFRVPVGKHTIRAGGWRILGNLRFHRSLCKCLGAFVLPGRGKQS